MTEKLPVFDSLGISRVPRPVFIPPPGRRWAGLVIEDTRALREPAWIGTSCGAEPKGAAGTIGCRVIDAQGTVYLLSCWHVLVKGKSLRVRHPGSQDSEATLAGCVSLGPVIASVRPAVGGGLVNVTDAALCKLDDPGSVVQTTPTGGYGSPGTEPTAPRDGMAVLKYGRTTRQTRGVVQAARTSLVVTYGAGPATFAGVCVVRSEDGMPWCKPGDSGALVVESATLRPVGIVFGQAARGQYGLVAPLAETFAALEALGLVGLRVDTALAKDTPQ